MKIYFLVATQHDNLGDLLINKMLIDEVCKYGIVYVDAAGVPASFKATLISKKGVKDFEKEYGGSLKRLSGYKLLAKVKEEFSYYFKSPGPFGGFNYNYKSLIRTAVIAYQFNYLSKGDIKLNLVGNDIVLLTKLDRWFLKNTNKCFRNYLVRSTENRNQLLALGFNNIGFIPDVAFLYDNYTDVKVKKEKVSVSFRNLQDDTYKQKIISILSKSISFFKMQGLVVEFFYQVESDYEFNYYLFQKFQEEGVQFISKCLTYDEILYFNKSKYVITNRLHVMILGITHGAVPILVLNDNQKTAKINRIIKDNKLDNLIIDSFETLKNIDSKYDGVYDDIKQIKDNNKRLIISKIKDLFTLV